MKINPIITEIIRGEWFLDVHNLHVYEPIIQAILAGEKFEFVTQAKPKAILSFIDTSGKKIQPDDDNSIQVPEGTIAIVKMKGEVIKEGNFCVYGADEITSALYQAQRLENTIGTIFMIDGPGGAVSAMGPFQNFAKYKTKPVVVLADHALSLHYFTAAVIGDHIIADNDISARFGSIGVMSTFTDNSKYLEEKGIIQHIINAPESKHKNLAFKLALEKKYDMIKEEFLSPMAKKFQQAVRDNRPKLKEEVGVLTGKTFTAEESLRLGLIDNIGDLQTAIMQVVTLNAIHQF